MMNLFKRNRKAVKVVTNNKLLKENGIYFAALATYTNGTQEVVVTDEYHNAPKMVRDFLYWHEVGHMVHNHNGLRSLVTEEQADAYAVKHIGKTKAIIALNYMWTTLSTVDVSACMDIPSRLKDIGANVDSMYIVTGNGTVLTECMLRAMLNKGE